MYLDEENLAALLETLSPFEQAFAEEFMHDLNPTKAAKRVGLGAPSSYAKAAGEYLNRQRVKAYIAHLKAEVNVGKEFLADRVVAELSKIAFQNVGDMLEVDEMGNVRLKRLEDMDDGGAALSSVDVSAFADTSTLTKIKAYDKLKALEMLGKHCAIFTDNVNHTNNGGDFADPVQTVNITINHRRAGEPLSQ